MGRADNRSAGRDVGEPVSEVRGLCCRVRSADARHHGRQNAARETRFEECTPVDGMAHMALTRPTLQLPRAHVAELDETVESAGLAGGRPLENDRSGLL